MAEIPEIDFVSTSVINSNTSSASWNFVGMDSLVQAADNYQKPIEDIDSVTFLKFMDRIPICDYYGVTREVYTALSSSEKKEKINRYYSKMKARVESGKRRFFFFF